MFLRGVAAHMEFASNRSAIQVLIAAVLVGMLGCGEEPAPVDETPFRQAIDEYLDSNNMALAIKAIKEGPTISGDNAQLSASLVHQELGGPSVIWSFHFERGQNGKWSVVRHED